MLNPLKDDVKAELARNGFDDIRVTIECVGRPETVQYAIEYAGKAAHGHDFRPDRPGLRHSLLPVPGLQEGTDHQDLLCEPGHPRGRAAAIIASGRLNLHDLISDRVALSDTARLSLPAPATVRRSFFPDSDPF